MGMSSLNLKATSKRPPAPHVLHVARGVVAQWDGAAQAKINRLLEWEVTSVSPASVKVMRL
jgi:hypothetical protein